MNDVEGRVKVKVKKRMLQLRFGKLSDAQDVSEKEGFCLVSTQTTDRARKGDRLQEYCVHRLS